MGVSRFTSEGNIKIAVALYEEQSTRPWESNMNEFNSAGQETYPHFLNPCPARCGSTGGCKQCIIVRNYNNTFTYPIYAPPYKFTEQTPHYDQYEGLTKEEEKRFYHTRRTYCNGQAIELAEYVAQSFKQPIQDN